MCTPKSVYSLTHRRAPARIGMRTHTRKQARAGQVCPHRHARAGTSTPPDMLAHSNAESSWLCRTFTSFTQPCLPHCQAQCCIRTAVCVSVFCTSLSRTFAGSHQALQSTPPPPHPLVPPAPLGMVGTALLLVMVSPAARWLSAPPGVCPEPPGSCL